ncbi:DUF4974 domain-containing protein [Paludibacter sp.]
MKFTQTTEDRLWDLISKEMSNSISNKEQQELLQIIEHNPQLKKTYNALNILEPTIESHSHDSEQNEIYDLINNKIFSSNEVKPTQHRTLPYWISIAAMFILLLSMGYYTLTFDKISDVEINTPKGVYSKIELPDGTLVHLNSGSKMIYPTRFKGNERKVKLWGEGYFEVKKDNKPFIVSSQRIRVKVLGTAFNLKNYPSDSISVVTLERGSIELGMVNHKNKIIMKPNEQIVLNKLRSQMLINHNIQASDFSSWKDGEFIFKAISFPDLCNSIERRYNYNFVIKNNAYNSATFTGKFRQGESVQEIMDIIKINTPIDYKIIKDTVYIY